MNFDHWDDVASNANTLFSIWCSDTPIENVASPGTCNGTFNNCDQKACVQNAAAAWQQLCVRCERGYWGTTAGAQSFGTTACATAANASIANCDYYTANGIDASTWRCLKCASNYTATYDQKQCAQYATITNCKRMNYTNEICGECDDNYYWSGTSCIMGYDASTSNNSSSSTTTTTGSNLMNVTAFIMTLLMFLN